MMKGIVKAAKIATKIVEVFHWVGTALMLAATVCSLAAPAWVKYFVGINAKECCGAELNVYGFEVIAPVKNGSVDMKALFLFGIGAVIILSLMAMVFRNLNLIIKKSEGSTPFQADNIRMLKEIGIFSFSIPLVGLIMSIICRLILGVDAVETSINFYGFFMGIVVLCLTQFFIHGAELEKDVDGLL
ncbi:MAG: hypothetical protein SOR38_06275 [Oscillospiraceae bacterium]|nr:hypothetical protein [Oscillospiraceae bacterium]MDY3065402.1 hypothetical protein [Oscillospiraceae bacterium]